MMVTEEREHNLLLTSLRVDQTLNRDDWMQARRDLVPETVSKRFDFSRVLCYPRPATQIFDVALCRDREVRHVLVSTLADRTLARLDEIFKLSFDLVLLCLQSDFRNEHFTVQRVLLIEDKRKQFLRNNLLFR